MTLFHSLLNATVFFFGHELMTIKSLLCSLDISQVQMPRGEGFKGGLLVSEKVQD